MKGSTILVVLLVVTSQVLNVRAEEHQPSALSEQVGDFGRRELQIIPDILRAAKARAAALASNSFDGIADEDHANIQLDKISQAHQYSLVPMVDSDFNRQPGFVPILEEVVEEAIANRMNRKPRNYHLDSKEYRFVPVFPSTLGRNWRSVDKLRDMILSNAPSYSPKRIWAMFGDQTTITSFFDLAHYYLVSPWVDTWLTHLHRVHPLSFSCEHRRAYPSTKNKADENNHYEIKGPDVQRGTFINGGSSKINEREKRRRCKGDPNLGIKNPAYCDSESFFGAADYGIRDMWDSAGR